MRAGHRNREVVIQYRATTQSSIYGSTVEGGWQVLATVWAEVQDVLPSRTENMTNDINIARRPTRVRMLYRDDVTSEMRLVIAAVPAAGLLQRTMQIVAGPAEIGFREGIEMMAEEMTTEGDAP